MDFPLSTTAGAGSTSVGNDGGRLGLEWWISGGFEDVMAGHRFFAGAHDDNGGRRNVQGRMDDR